MTSSMLNRAALSPWLLLCALSWSQGTFKTGSKLNHARSAQYRARKQAAYRWVDR